MKDKVIRLLGVAAGALVIAVNANIWVAVGAVAICYSLSGDEKATV